MGRAITQNAFGQVTEPIALVLVFPATASTLRLNCPPSGTLMETELVHVLKTGSPLRRVQKPPDHAGHLKSPRNPELRFVKNGPVTVPLAIMCCSCTSRTSHLVDVMSSVMPPTALKVTWHVRRATTIAFRAWRRNTGKVGRQAGGVKAPRQRCRASRLSSTPGSVARVDSFYRLGRR